MPNFRALARQNNGGGVYLKRLQYERPVSVMTNPANRYVFQDALIAGTMARQDAKSSQLRADASLESTYNSRYGLVLKQYVDLLTGFSEYFR